MLDIVAQRDLVKDEYGNYYEINMLIYDEKSKANNTTRIHLINFFIHKSYILNIENAVAYYEAIGNKDPQKEYLGNRPMEICKKRIDDMEKGKHTGKIIPMEKILKEFDLVQIYQYLSTKESQYIQFKK